jgi:glycosyltransferase involved in cell wall biosynthesis
MKPPKVAIVAAWLTGVGGAEQVIRELHRTFPEAPIYTSTYEPNGSTMLKGADIRTSWMQKLPKSLRKHQLLTIPRQWYFGRLKLSGYDVIISAGSTEEKATRAPDGVHINMCYTPTLQYWVKPDNYIKKGSDGLNVVWRIGLKMLLPYVKRWDLKASKRPDHIYAISTAVQERIKKHYGRESELLYPPADIERFRNDGTQKRDGFVIFGRHVQHKRFDLAIKACNELRAKLIVVGEGPETARLKAMAGPTIDFKGRVADDNMINYISRAEAFVFPNEEDFGIVAVESQAAGTPVIAYRAGGALDTVIAGETGEFFDEQTIGSLVHALRNFNYKLYNRTSIVTNAERFSNEIFQQAVKNIVVKNVQ